MSMCCEYHQLTILSRQCPCVASIINSQANKVHVLRVSSTHNIVAVRKQTLRELRVDVEEVFSEIVFSEI
jgi:hypothetical protein